MMRTIEVPWTAVRFRRLSGEWSAACAAHPVALGLGRTRAQARRGLAFAATSRAIGRRGVVLVIRWGRG